MSPRASILVAILDEAAVIESTAPLICGQDYDGDLEILFLDGGSTDGTLGYLAGLAERDARVRVLPNPGRTQVAALNLGLREAGGEVIVQMDAHAFYPAGYVSAGVRRLRRGDVGWVTGPPLPRGTDAGSRRVALALSSRLGTGGAGKWRAAGPGTESDLDTGVFGGVWWRSTLEGLGGWDERFVANHDSELAGRHLAAGGRIVCLGDMAAEYVPRSSLPALWRQYRGYGYYRAGTFGLHPESLRPSHLLSMAPVVALAGALLPGPAGRLARAGLGVYGATIAAASARLAREGEPADALALPAVFATMHVSWGAGFVSGCRRFGVPSAAFGSVARRIVSRVAPPARP